MREYDQRPGEAAVFALVLGMLFSVSLFAEDLYVAPSGTDSGPGTQAQPFATPERARDAVRTLLKQASRKPQPITVFLRGGRYPLSRTLQLAAEDSGSDSAPVVWRAYANERVVLTGGKSIGGFKPLSDANAKQRIDGQYHSHVVQADLKAQGIAEIPERTQTGFGREQKPAAMELFFRDQPMTVARWPNNAWERIIDVPQAWEGGAVPEDPGYYRLQAYGIPLGRHYGYFSYYGERPKRWKAVEDVWLHGFWAFDYRDSYVQVDRIDTARGHIYPKPPHPQRYGYTKGQRFYYLNILEELDSPGEYYIDRKSGVLYFWPPADLREGDAWLTSLGETLVVFQQAAHVSLEGIALEGGRSHAIRIDGGHHIRIAGCTIRNVGNYAVTVTGANQTVESCDIYGTGEGGITLGGGDTATLAASGNRALNNHIHHYARINLANHPAIRISGVGNRAANNYIHDAPHGALTFNGNDNVIEFNEFHTIAKVTGDVGVIYGGGGLTGRGNIIRHNYFHHIKTTSHGYGVVTTYLDNNSSGQTVYGNVYFDVPRAVYIGGGRDNVVENNLMINCRPAFHLDPRGLNWRLWEIGQGMPADLYKALEKVRHKEPPYNKYPGLANIPGDGDPKAPSKNLVARNLVVGGMWKEFVDQWAEMEPQSIYADTDREKQFVTYQDNLLLEDPGFVDPWRFNFNLRPDSEALKLGFKPIPFDKIGLYKDAFRTSLPGRQPWLY